MRKSEVVLLATFVFLSAGWKSAHPTIEIQRDENNGRMNVIPCLIELRRIDATRKSGVGLLDYFVVGSDGKKENRTDKKGRLFLVGGDRAILKVEKGEYRIRVYTPPEDQGEYVPSNTKTWISNYVDLTTSGDKRYVLVVEPTSDDNGYNGGWTVHLRKK